MLKKSTVNKPAPFKDMGDAHGPSAHPMRPNSPGSMKNRTLVDEAPKKASGRPTFNAPRKGDDMNPMACGYTKLK